MGCGSSRGAAVTKIQNVLPENETKKISNEKPSSAIVQRPPSAGVKKQQAAAELVPKRRPESGAVSISNVGMRTTSATSTKSSDSGIGHETTHESELKQKTISEIPFERPNEEKIVHSLRAEGLLDDPSTKTEKGGLTFEVPSNDIRLPLRRPPPRLAKLDRNGKMNFSQEQIREKLAKAEKKRKVREKEKLQKSRERDTKNLEVKLALLEFEKKKEKDLGTKLTTNIESHLGKREKFLETVVERQKLEAKKVDEAKNRKFENSMNLPQEEYEMLKAKKVSVANLDDLPVGPTKL